MLKFITTFVTLVTVSSGYYNHGTAIHSPYNNYNYYGNNANYAPIVGSSSVPSLRPYKHITPISTHLQSKVIDRTSLPTGINAYSTFHGHNLNQNNNLNQHGYIQSGAEISSTASSSAAYLPPPTISPPSISYNNNFIAPSIRNLSHGVKTVPSTNYATHSNTPIINSHHNRFPIPYSSPISSHISEPMCRCF